MGKILVVAEKPSAAKDMAKVLGCDQRKKGYLEGDEYIVTWAIGHLIGLKMPHEHDIKYKVWNLDDLPIIFHIEDSLKILPDTEKQFQVIKKLMNDQGVDSIINAGDAGREGYLIQSWIYRMVGNRKKVKVLWASSLTEEALRKAFANLKDDKEFTELLQEAEARAEADYMLGMNYSRALTLTKSQDTPLSYGRCQTPLLNLIVTRDAEIDSFKPVPYFQIKSEYSQGFTGLLSENREEKVISFLDIKDAEQVYQECNGKTAVVKEFLTEDKTKKAPLLFSLGALQKEMGKKFKFAPDKTLEIAQSLYEKYKIISYPRTDSQYLSTDLFHEIEKHIKSCRFGRYAEIIDRIGETAYRIADKSYFNDGKISDHHAIIPTINWEMEQSYQSLTENEKRVFDAVICRFLSIFYPPYIYASSTLITGIGKYQFISRGTTIKQLGYKEILPDKEENIEVLPRMREGEALKVSNLDILSKKTTPPPRYNVETIISVMEKYHIGTPATMSSIIENLQNAKRKFINLEKGIYQSTALGKTFIQVVPDRLKSPILTMEIEERLSSIGDGKSTKEAFLKDLEEEIKKDLEVFKVGGAVISRGEIGKCPICNNRVDENRFSFQCNTEGCLKVSKTICNKTISETIIKKLLEKGKTGVINGFEGKSGIKFDAMLVLDKNNKSIAFEFPKYNAKKRGK